MGLHLPATVWRASVHTSPHSCPPWRGMRCGSKVRQCLQPPHPKHRQVLSHDAEHSTCPQGQMGTLTRGGGGHGVSIWALANTAAGPHEKTFGTNKSKAAQKENAPCRPCRSVFATLDRSGSFGPDRSAPLLIRAVLRQRPDTRRALRVHTHLPDKRHVCAFHGHTSSLSLWGDGTT